MEISSKLQLQSQQPALPTRLMNWNFLMLWQGQFVSLLGGHVNSVALVFVIKHATESGTMIGLIMMISGLARVLLSGIGGAVADHYPRRTILVLSDLLRGFVVLILALLLFTRPEATPLIMGTILLCAIIIAASGAFYGPSLSAALPDLVPTGQVGQANSLRQLTVQLSLFVGQSLGGVLYRVVGAPLLVLINGVSFLFSAGSVALITIPHAPPAKQKGWRAQMALFWAEIAEGWRYVRRHPGLSRLFLASALLNLFSMSIIVLLPFFVEDYLGVAPDWYGYLLAIYGAGLLLGSLGAGFIKLSGRKRAEIMILFMIFNSLFAASLGAVTNLFSALGFAFCIGAMAGFNSTNTVSILQVSTPSAMRGRVFGLSNTLAGSTVPLGMGLGGLVFDLTGQNIPLVFIGSGVMMALVAIGVASSREFRTFLAHEH